MSGLVNTKVKVGAVLAIVASLLMTAAMADVVEIRAEFTPDPSNPGLNRFINTTPYSGYCASYPTQCDQRKIFSVQSHITVESNAPIQANHGVRKGPMFQIPAYWKDVDVLHEDGSATEKMQLRVTSIGSTYTLSDSAKDLTGRPEVTVNKAHGLLWGGRENDSSQGQWSSPPRPCTSTTNHSFSNDTNYSFYWSFPVAQTCGKTAAFDIPGFAYSKLEFMYEMVTPNPLKMKAGIYTGSVRFSVGPMMDFDFGDIMIPSDSELVFSFTLKVDHILKVEIPPGGNKVALLPDGGWQQWLNQGRRPTRLFRDQTFNIWTSTAFKMSMECEHYAANSTCAVQDDKNNTVPVDVSVSLPSGLSGTDHQPVSRRRLRVDGIGTERFEPTLYVDRKPGILHFEVSQRAVEEMLQRDSQRYSGDITVIWDSQV